MTTLRLARLPLVLLCAVAGFLLVRALSGATGNQLELFGLPILRVGVVESLLLLLVAGIGFVVTTYSVRNLQGQRGLTRYAVLVLLTVGSLALAVTSSSLLLLAVAWAIASQALSGLVAHAGTPSSFRASRLVRARLVVGDVLLWSGVLITGFWVGAWDRGALPEAVTAAPSTAVTLAALLTVGAGVVRSALVPAHRWLPETAEAPSPVSALLHAGFVNGVGVLALLLWPLVQTAWPARVLLVAVGVASALLGAAQLRTRGDLKGRLAASTSSQMGYLALQVGLGIPAAVVAHIVGHGVWKARKFLGAGGAVQRARSGDHPAARPVTWSESVACGAVAAVTIAIVAEVPLGGLPPLTAPAELLTLAVAAAVTTVAAVTVRGVPVPAGARSAAVAVVVVAGVGYVLSLRLLSSTLAPTLGEPRPWGSTGGWLSLAAVVAVALGGAGWAHVDRVARSGRLPTLARRVGQASLQPWTASERLRRRPAAAVAAGVTTGSDADAARDHMALAAASTATLYPLTTFVASNPLAGIEGMGFTDAHRVAGELWDAAPGPSASVLRAAIERGAASGAAVERALDAGNLPARGVRLPGLAGRDLRDVARALLVDDAPAPQRQLLAESALRRVGVPGLPAVRTPMEALGDPRLDRRVRELSHHLCLRSLAGASWPGSADPWQELRAHGPRLDALVRVRGAIDCVLALPSDPAAAVAAMLDDLGVAPVERPRVIGRLLARDPGWPAHLAWRSRHARLGREAGLDDAVADDLLPALVATRLALEAVVAQAYAPRVTGRRLLGSDLVTTTVTPLARLLASEPLGEVDLAGMPDADLRALASSLTPLAAGALASLRSEILEAGSREDLFDRLAAADAPLGDTSDGRPRPSSDRPEAQVVTCIDVRSERLRRHLEHRGAWETFGAAGFFGLPVRHVDGDGQVSERTPALLRPSTTVVERRHPAEGVQGTLTALSAAVAALESTPPLALGWAEAAGWVLAPALAVTTLRPGSGARPSVWLQERLSLPHGGRLDVVSDVGVAELADSAAGFLAGNGIAEPAPLVVLMGHGASVANNPHVAAYDCGACGGAAGDVSARVMAAALNDARVRSALLERGVAVPAHTRFVAALHDTTTDEVRVLEAEDLPARHRELLARLQSDLRSAGADVRGERLARLPDVGAPTGRSRRAVARRAADWAQPRPEWGLAGAAAIVVGPRWLTERANLDGTVFLQSYRPELDPSAEVLAGLLSAPVVVAHWITAQYRAATVDPHRFGAGDKTTHNVVGDADALSAVVTGARGDLRIGLPWQAVSACAPHPGGSDAGEPWPESTHHTPQRLLVMVCADVAQVETALVRSPEAAGLVAGEWVTLCAVDPVTGDVSRRLADGSWVHERQLGPLPGWMRAAA